MDLAVVVPVGPGDDAMDTLNSIVHYTAGELDLVVVDDAPARSLPYDEILDRVHGHGVVIPASRDAPGGHGGLYVKLAQGLTHIAEHLDPRIVLRIDADALMIGPDVAAQPRELVETTPRIGILGSYRTGPDGGTRNFAHAVNILRVEAGPLGLLCPRRRRVLRHLLRSARTHGYEMGEHALGGAYFLAPAAVRDLHARGWLALTDLASSHLGEDHIFALLVRAAGYTIAEVGGPGDTLAVQWQGLPASPETLAASKAGVTHSVRFWSDWNEESVRAYFRERRTG